MQTNFTTGPVNNITISKLNKPPWSKLQDGLFYGSPFIHSRCNRTFSPPVPDLLGTYQMIGVAVEPTR